jgi:hypothetical protein
MLTVVWKAEDAEISREDEGKRMEIEAQVVAQPADQLEMRDLLFRAIGAITLIAIAFFALSIA